MEKRKLTKLLISCLSVITFAGVLSSTVNYLVDNINQSQTDSNKKGTTSSSEIEVKTISELGNAVIAGTGAYYDDGTLYYDNSGNTIGYNLDHSNSVFEFDVIFDQLTWPAWLSLNFKVSGFDRTQAPALEQKGYSFVIYSTGQVDVWKPDMTTITTYIPEGITIGLKYHIQVGAYNVDNAVNLFLNINGVDIINQKDETNPYLTGDWFNICADGITKARFFSTKVEKFPDYNTYTLSTFVDYPLVSPYGVAVDEYNNINLYSSAGTFGYHQFLQNCSIEFNVNFSEFTPGSNLWIGMRVGGFDRANSAGLVQKGYTFRLASMGVIDIYKEGAWVASGGIGFTTGVDYVVEVGTVDLDANNTQVFALVNNVPVVSYVDSTNPIQTSGLFTMNGDGVVNCVISSSNTKLIPLMTKVEETETEYVIKTYFGNTISYTDMDYEDFSSILLEAIQVNGDSISYLNSAYYAINNEKNVRAVDLQYIDNCLIITMTKDVYISSNDQSAILTFNGLTIKKTSQNAGLICPSGFVLKQTYYYNV